MFHTPLSIPKEMPWVGSVLMCWEGLGKGREQQQSFLPAPMYFFLALCPPEVLYFLKWAGVPTKEVWLMYCFEVIVSLEEGGPWVSQCTMLLTSLLLLRFCHNHLFKPKAIAHIVMSFLFSHSSFFIWMVPFLFCLFKAKQNKLKQNKTLEFYWMSKNICFHTELWEF